MSYPQYTQTQDFSNQQTGAQSASDDSSLKDNAAQAAQEGKQAATDVAQSAAERAGEVKDEATRQARDLLGEARKHVTQQAGQGHQAAVSNLRSLGDELGRMSSQSGESGIATELAGQAQQRVTGLADWLDSREPGQIVDEVRNFARRQPTMFLLGALAAGVAAGRLARGAVELHTGDGDSSTTAEVSAGTASAAPTTSLPESGNQFGSQSAYTTPTYSAPQTDAPTPGLPTPGLPTQGLPTPGVPTQGQPTQGQPSNGSWQ